MESKTELNCGGNEFFNRLLNNGLRWTRRCRLDFHRREKHLASAYSGGLSLLAFTAQVSVDQGEEVVSAASHRRSRWHAPHQGIPSDCGSRSDLRSLDTLTGRGAFRRGGNARSIESPAVVAPPTPEERRPHSRPAEPPNSQAACSISLAAPCAPKGFDVRFWPF